MRRNFLLLYGLFFVSMSILGGLSFIFYDRYSIYTRYADDVESTYQVITEVNKLGTYLKDAESGQRGFLLTRDSAYLEPYTVSVEKIKSTFGRITELTEKNSSQVQRLKDFNIIVLDKLKSMEHTRLMFIVGSKSYEPNLKLSKEKMDECLEILHAIEGEELQLLQMRQAKKEIVQSQAPEYMKALFAFSTLTFIISFVLIVRQFRNRIEYQKELEKKVRELDQSKTELEQIAYVTSHDLQEPLRKINTFSDRLESKYAADLDAEGKKILERISYASSRMRDLIEDLGNFTNLIRPNETKSSVDLAAVVDTVLNRYRSKISSRNATVTHNGLPVIQGYSQQLVLLFESLIDNSLKFARENESPVISINYSIPDSNDISVKSSLTKFARIVIRDNGIGFDNEFSEKLFAIFQRLHNQQSEYAGKGVGLAIVKRVMTNHNGHVLATGKLMQGAEFTLLFPLE